MRRIKNHSNRDPFAQQRRSENRPNTVVKRRDVPGNSLSSAARSWTWIGLPVDYGSASGISLRLNAAARPHQTQETKPYATQPEDDCHLRRRI